MNDYDDLIEYDDDYDYDDDGYNDSGDYDYYYEWIESAAWDVYYSSWRGRLDRLFHQVKNHLEHIICWLKWHNHKCQVCGKPALYDGKVCYDCSIPF